MSQSPIDDFSSAAVMRYRQGWKALNRLLHQERSFSGREANCAFLNTGSGRFADISAVSGLDYPDDGRAVALVDWDFDGDLDLWTTNRTAPRIRFLRNNATSDHGHLSIKLRGDGRSTNSDAIGARVEVYLEGDRKDRFIKTLHAGDGFLAQSSSWIHFGLGDGIVDRIDVHWPGGTVETFRGISRNGFYLFEQGSGRATLWTPPPQSRALIASTPKLPKSDAVARIVLPARLPFPKSEYTDDQGENVAIGIPAGHPTLVNLWGSWCTPCVAELSDWTSHEAEFRSQKLEVVAISMDNLDKSSGDVNAARSLLDRLHFPFRRGFATQRLVRNFDFLLRATLDLWRPLPVPSSCLLDQHGQVAVIYLGPIHAEQLVSDLRLLHASPSELRNLSVPFAGHWITEPGMADPLRMCTQFIDQMDVDGAVAYLERYAALSKQGHTGETNTNQLADVYYVLGTLFNEQRRQDAALGAFKKATEFNPADIRVHRDLVALLLQQGQTTEAADQLESALKQQPDNVAFHGMLATIRYDQRQFDDAVEHFRMVLSSQPNNIGVHLNLASSYRAAGDYQAAVAAYRETLRIQSGNALAANNLAWILATHSDPSIRDGQEALRLAQQLTDGNTSGNPNLWGTLGAAFAEVGQFDQAVLAVEQAGRLAREPSNDQRNETLIKQIDKMLQSFRSNRPYREGE